MRRLANSSRIRFRALNVPATVQNREYAMEVYTVKCPLCHGELDRKPQYWGRHFIRRERI
jgi:hypothetical protein